MTREFFCYAFNFSFQSKEGVDTSRQLEQQQTQQQKKQQQQHQRQQQQLQQQTTSGHGSPFYRRKEEEEQEEETDEDEKEKKKEKPCGYRKNRHIFFGQRKNVHFFLFLIFVFPFFLSTSDAGFPCLSFKCHCVFKSNKLIADCIGLNAIPEVSKELFDQ